jgi:hypothetical protein
MIKGWERVIQTLPFKGGGQIKARPLIGRRSRVKFSGERLEEAESGQS